MRKIALGFLALVLGAAACSDGGLPPGSGRTQVLITDAPLPSELTAALAAANVKLVVV